MTSSNASFVVDQTPFNRGITLIEASAGTGKTFTIAMSVVRLLLETDGEHPVVDGLGSILVVTYTKAATEELVTRIRSILHLAREVWSGERDGESSPQIEMLRRMADAREAWALMRAEQAVAALDALSVFTIHGFCHRVLDEFALESGASFGAALLEDGESFLEEAMEDWWRRRFYTDAALAAWAVANEWTPKTFAADYRIWQRWPGAEIDPAVTVCEAREAVRGALEGFGGVWSVEDVRETLGSIRWNQGARIEAAIASPEALTDLDRLVALALEGSLSAAQEVVEMLRADKLREYANKRGAQDRAAADALLHWPVAQRASDLHQALSVLEQSLRVDCLQASAERVRGLKEERQVLDFDDLLGQLHSVLTSQGSDGLLATAIRRRYQAALIDEFQDTDYHQFHIFQTIFARQPLFLIGDPKQAIYGFRGADVRAYIASGDAAEYRYTLGNNFRSTPDMVESVNALFSWRPAPFADPVIQFHPAKAAGHPAPDTKLKGEHALQWLFLPPDQQKGKPSFNGAERARTIFLSACAEIVGSHVADGWDPRHIAVLVRARHEGVTMVRLLADIGVPAVLTGVGDVMHSEEMTELRQVLEAIATPGDTRRVRAALGTRLWGFRYTDLVRLNSPVGEFEWEEISTQFAELRELWLARGVLQLLGHIFEVRQVVARFLTELDGERRLTNLRHLQELLHDASESEAPGMEGLLRWLTSVQADGADARGVRELRLERDSDAVRVMTVHASKGLEFEIVLCPTLWSVRRAESSTPVLVHEGERVIFDHGSTQHARRAAEVERERLAEDCRLLYVALTRARYRTYVSWGPIGRAPNGSEHSALSWLLYRGGTPADSPDVVAENLRSAVGTWESMLQELVHANPSLMSLDVLDTWRPGRRVPSLVQDGETPLAARALPVPPSLPERLSTFSISSFTSLTAGSYEALRAEAHEAAARDRDDQSEQSVIAPSVHDPGDFRTFPAGTGPGIVLHALFEHTDFAATNESLRGLIEEGLASLSMSLDERSARIDAVLAMMQLVLRSPVGPLSFSLDQVSTGRTKREWQFLLPLASAGHALTKQGIAHAFERHGGERGVRYAERLRRLASHRVHGFLTGFVDLVFQHDGRWYVVDWKSNQLGFEASAYAPGTLEQTMIGHHYVLQYHLYLVALHRFLRQRVPGYHYETHMGGAAYAFLRGFSSFMAPGDGWYFDRPDVALIEALDALLAGHPLEANI